jgi:hypothetical protein
MLRGERYFLPHIECMNVCVCVCVRACACVFVRLRSHILYNSFMGMCVYMCTYIHIHV